MTHAVTFRPVTTALRDWLRGNATISAFVSVDGNGLVAVYAGGLPSSPEFPAIVVHRIGGAPDPIGPVDSGNYQFDCWAEKASDAESLGMLLASLLHSTGTEPLTADLDVTGANVVNSAAFPDDIRPDLNRWLVAAQVVTRTST